ncbi:pyridoxal phosphate-dependent aminotransferase [Halalkaliarchaeum sp. AArc-GB]|uniref:pyridoxal phosphate-dependent aminotransferase n=1 Tax=Halalkaliarchaeum sp. AArc-GB TaxID=3074078 RepID=UPI00285D7450|nr:pyridoxal phosphate-dependent aminotransferase [Halalkaliarchaeum sp. AArc-GB]MDR5671806.1 pyridoxal phosphate-dependent aminotransferase [Halalkaliarchaeum sp. AArc-GB]
MINFSNRVNAVEPAAPFVITNLVSELQEQGEDIVDLSVGQPDFETPDEILEATHEALDAGHTTYTPSDGIPKLRRAAAGYLNERHGLDYAPENIIATPGGKQALFETVMAIVDPGDEVIVFDPVWSSYEPMVKLAGGEAVHVDLAPYDFRLEPALDDLAEAITDDTALIMLNSPVNPSGMVFSRAAFEGVRDLAVDHDIPVISDEIYKELIFEKEQPSLAALDGMFDRTITINGVSKTYSMTGYRLGFMAAPTDHTTQAGKVHSHSVSCASNFVQHAAAEALGNADTDAIAGEMKETFRRRSETLVDLFAERGVDIPEPESAFYAMIPIESDDDMQWCKDAVREAGVGLVPGQAFGTPGYVRASVVDTEERIREAVDRLDAEGFI